MTAVLNPGSKPDAGPSAVKPPIRVRDAEDADMAAVAAIYAHHVRFGLASFEETAPDVAEISRRRREVLGHGLPYIVACDLDGEIAGFGYAAPYRTRAAYRYAVEDTVYVAPGATRRGVGRALLEALIERCTAIGLRQMVAIIGDSTNAPSIELHASLGFRSVGVLRAIGFKHGRWVDTVLMQRPLGPGGKTVADPGRRE
ncbi:MAG: GNAT family N-acetyltransferase [Kiloniellales bacterium]